MKSKVTNINKSRILEIHVELNYLEPRIWRRFLVNDSISMSQLHETLQVVMGWTNSHLYMFHSKGVVISEPTPEDEFLRVEVKDANKTPVSQIFKKPKDSINYEYDHGDSWAHTLRLERIVDQSEVNFKLPRCIAGKNACPPEDCGGFPGFEELKRVISDPENDEYEDMIEWLDEEYPNYDPEEFSLNQVNKILKGSACQGGG